MPTNRARRPTIQPDVPVFCDWVDATARFIHAQDPNHLVCTGREGIHGCLDKQDVFIAAHKTPAIDYVTVHMWLKNWGWLKEPQLGPDFEIAAGKARDHVEMHNRIATDILKKPLVLEEFGLPRDHESYAPGFADDGARRILPPDVRSGGGILPRPGARCRRRISGRGAAKAAPARRKVPPARFLGDPPSEPQGLNSVFDTDAGTLAVIQQANGKLAVLCG